MALILPVRMRFWLLPFNVSCARLCLQAPASASVVPSSGVRVVDTGVSGLSFASRVGELAADCRELVVVSSAVRRSSAGGAASYQVMHEPWAV